MLKSVTSRRASSTTQRLEKVFPVFVCYESDNPSNDPNRVFLKRHPSIAHSGLRTLRRNVNNRFQEIDVLLL